MLDVKQMTVTPGDTTENIFHVGRCLVYSVVPRVASTAGTVTLRDSATAAGSTAKRVCPIATLQAGVHFGGVLFVNGLTVQLSNSADLTDIVWVAI